MYAADLDAFAWIAPGTRPGRCIEAQVMDWADDVAYSVHDVEDGMHSGHIRCRWSTTRCGRTLCRGGRRAVLAPNRRPSSRRCSRRLLELPTLRDLAGYDGSYAAQAAAKRATSELTGRFAGAAVAATRAAHGEAPLARYAADLVVPDAIAAECALLKAVAAHYVMRRRVARRPDGRAAPVLLRELVAAIVDRAPATPRPLPRRRRGTRPVTTARGCGR